MAMMVKSGARTLGQEALTKLDTLERNSPAVSPPTARERTAVAGRGRVRHTVVDREYGYVELDVSYRSGNSARDLPRRIRVSRPPEYAVENIYKLVGDTWEVKIALLSCLPDALATEDFLESLSTKSYLAVQSVALSLVFGERWRTVLAKAVVEGLIGPRSEIDRLVDRKAKEKS